MLKRILLSIVLLLVIAYLVVAITAFNRALRRGKNSPRHAAADLPLLERGAALRKSGLFRGSG